MKKNILIILGLVFSLACLGQTNPVYTHNAYIDSLQALEDDSITIKSVLSMRANQIKNMADPTDDQDAATKAYVDDNSGGATINNDADNRVTTANGDGTLNAEANLTFDGSDLTLFDEFNITNDNSFDIQNTSSGVNSSVNLFTNDGDGTDAVYFQSWAVGTPTSVTNRERLLLGWNESGYFNIRSDNAGTGSNRPIRIHTNGNTSQLILGIDNSVSINSAAASSSDELVSVNSSGVINNSGILVSDIVSGTVESGSYTPVIIDGSNTTGTSNERFYYRRVDNIVTVYGYVSVSFTANSANTTFDVPLPVSTDITQSNELMGWGGIVSLSGKCYQILGSVSNDRAVVTFISPSSGTGFNCSFWFTYEIN